ncbi:MAG TPA: type II secretion system F family protein [Solirubrobacterales bacterium]|nr:type II secretion system F family protein [Solirubrobacterales bacterium]
MILRLGLGSRLARAGLSNRISAEAVLAAKLGAAGAGALWAIVAAPAAPPRLAWVVAVGLPVAGFLGPDAWLERRARRRLGSLRASLPDALDLLAVGTAAGRSPLAGIAELGTGEGPLARELAMLSAESSCGAPQREALEALRRRAPVREVAAMCGVIERSRRYGSPLADQLREQATALRAAQSRRIEERAARAAPKIQLAVALLLVPSVLLMIAAGLLANVDRFLAGL